MHHQLQFFLSRLINVAVLGEFHIFEKRANTQARMHVNKLQILNCTVLWYIRMCVCMSAYTKIRRLLVSEILIENMMGA